MVSIRGLVFAPILALLAMGAPTTCDYSCPSADEHGHSLLGRPHAIPLVSDYSIFECIYGITHSNAKQQTCTYDKVTGIGLLKVEENGCPTQAHACSEVEEPLFSAQEGVKVETPSWIDGGRYLLYLRENPPQRG